MLLNNSNTHVFRTDGIDEIELFHKPYFLVSWDTLEDDAKKNLENYVKTDKDIVGIDEPEEYESFVEFDKTSRKKKIVRKVYAPHPSKVPNVSDTLFKRYGRFGIECYQFDIPYKSLVNLELASTNEQNNYMFNTGGQEQELKVLDYDIETLKDGTICIVGYSSFTITVKSYLDLNEEKPEFKITDMPKWDEIEVEQLYGSPDDEPRLVTELVKQFKQHDIISGHNILAYDNLEVYQKCKELKDQKKFTKEQLNEIEEFLNIYCAKTTNFVRGQKEDGCTVYPNSLDTYLAFMKLYPKIYTGYTLKNLAQEFGIHIDGRIYFEGQEFEKTDRGMYYDNPELFQRFVEYNKHDVMEQNGLTLIALNNILPMSFLSLMPLEEIVLPSMNTKLGDNLMIVRCMKQKRIFPPMINAEKTCEKLYETFKKNYLSLDDIKSLTLNNDKSLNKIAKYGSEAPQWVYYPELLRNVETTGGLVVKPDNPEEMNEEEYYEESIEPTNTYLLVWWDVLAPDVGALYPTLMLAKNICADSIRFARKDEEPHDWVWMKNLTNKEQELIDECPYLTREPQFDFQKTGVEIGIIYSNQTGCVALALQGIVDLSKSIKSEIKKAETKDDSDILKGLYASVKAIRNAQTHGIQLAINSTCRQTNLGGCMIPFLGNRIMYDVYKEFKLIGA